MNFLREKFNLLRMKLFVFRQIDLIKTIYDKIFGGVITQV